MADTLPDNTEACRPIAVGVWGIGPHARRNVLPAVVACRSTRLVGITTRNIEIARVEAAKYGCRIWATPGEMLQSPEIDAVYLATPIGLHGAQGKEVLTADKHLWCEKSLTQRCADTEELCTLSRERKRALCEAFMYLYHPQFLRIKEALGSDGSLGKVNSIICRFGLPPLERPGFRYSRALGGGALLDVGSYPLSLVLHLAGEEPRVLTKRVDTAAGFEVDTSGLAVLEFPSGMVAYLEWGYERAYVNELVAWGTRGSLRSERVFSKPASYQASLEYSDAHGACHSELVGAADCFVKMLEVFARTAVDEVQKEKMRSETRRQARYLAALGAG
jgi:dTDP-3,4-didehydro-2,6-dideoxy-alpha-D-glucose 3-reductase